MDLPQLTVVTALLALVVCAVLAIWGSAYGDQELTAIAGDLLKVIVGAIAGALGVGKRTTS